MLAAAALAWRLSRGGIDLAVIVPVLERALARPALGLTAKIGAAELVWDPVARRPALRALDVRLLASGGETVVHLAEIAVRPSGSALLRGTFAPSAIELLAPRLRVVRAESGDLGVGVGEDGGAGDVLPRLLAGPPTPGAAQWLRRIEVRDGDLLVVDAASGRKWHALGAEMVVERKASGVTLVLAGSAELGGALVPIRAEALYRTEPPGAVATIRFDGLVPSAAAPLAPEGGARAALERIEVPIAGSVRLELDHNLDLLRVHLDADGGAGRIVVPEVSAAELPVRHLRLSASLDSADDRLGVEALVLDLDRAQVEMEATVAELHGARRVDARARVRSIAASDLAAWWPRGLVPAARGVVTTRIRGGMVHDVAVGVSGRVDAGRFVVETATGSARFDGVVARLLDAGPEARGLAGTLSFTRDRWRFRVARGALNELEVVHGSVDLDVAARRATVEAALRGPVATGLALARRVDQARDLAIDPDDVRGSMTAELQLGLPLRAPIRSADVDIAVSAAMRGVAVARAFREWSLSDGDLNLDLRGGALHLAGRGRLEGAPISLVWHEDARPGRARRRIEVAARLDSAMRAALGLDLRPWVDGVLDARVDLVADGGAGMVDIAADLGDATLDVPMLALQKAPGAAGSVEAHLPLAGGLVRGVERFRFSAGGVAVTARAELGSDGRAVRTLDAAATIRAPEGHRSAGHLGLAIVPAGAAHRFVVTSDDAGALFRAFESGAEASGGRLAYEGTVQLGAPGLPFDGRLTLDDFTLLRAPLLARVATLGSLAGIASALQGKGIRFEHLDAGIAHRGRTITIVDALAKGRAMNVLVAGTIDRDAAARCDLHGTVVPSYAGLNTAPGRVPVLGRVLTGAGAQGIQAVDFTATGPLRSPQVSVNPLSLAPGALRDLFRRSPTRR